MFSGIISTETLRDNARRVGNRNFAVWTLAVGFSRLRVKGEGAVRGEGEGCV